MEMRTSFSQKHLAPAHIAKTTSNWCTDHGITGLNWPANWPDLNSTENLCCIVKRKMRDTRPNHTDELKAAIKAILAFRNTSAVSQADHLHATPHWWRILFKIIPDQVLSATLTCPFRSWHFCIIKSFFWVVTYNILILWDHGFFISMSCIQKRFWIFHFMRNEPKIHDCFTILNILQRKMNNLHNIQIFWVSPV